MSHISYALVVHQASGRIVYKTRNKTGGDVTPTIKQETLPPFNDVCYIGSTLQPDYVIGRIALDDHARVNYETQRWDSETETLREATPEEIAEYQNVTTTATASGDVNGDKTLVALIEVVADLHDMTASDVTDLVVTKLREQASA